MTNKKRLLAQVAGPIEWLLAPEIGTEFPITAFPGWSLRNPLTWSSFEHDFLQLSRVGVLNGNWVVSSRGLSFEFDEIGTNQYFPEESMEVVSVVLRRLRYVSGQFSIPRMVVGYTTQPVASDSALLTHPGLDLSSSFVRNYRIPTALHGTHLARVACVPREFTIPIHADVMLDALEAHVEHDFRKALLYAAIALEAFTRDTLKRQAALNVNRTSSQHRAVALPIAAGGTVLKDPISDLLIESDTFSRLLHETCLYVIGRSLLLEQPEAYRLALRLYATRNKIAHVGAPPDDDKYFSTMLADSKDALGVAIAVMRWLGDDSPYSLWDGGLVPVVDWAPKD